MHQVHKKNTGIHGSTTPTASAPSSSGSVKLMTMTAGGSNGNANGGVGVLNQRAPLHPSNSGTGTGGKMNSGKTSTTSMTTSSPNSGGAGGAPTSKWLQQATTTTTYHDGVFTWRSFGTLGTGGGTRGAQCSESSFQFKSRPPFASY